MLEQKQFNMRLVAMTITNLRMSREGRLVILLDKILTAILGMCRKRQYLDYFLYYMAVEDGKSDESG